MVSCSANAVLKRFPVALTCGELHRGRHRAAHADGRALARAQQSIRRSRLRLAGGLVLGTVAVIVAAQFVAPMIGGAVLPGPDTGVLAQPTPAPHAQTLSTSDSTHDQGQLLLRMASSSFCRSVPS